ncbi:RNA polymerase sigma factor [Fulvivirga lutea]|uniref:RNA polymerase sigma factor n=1 Tax=Fulvivirga lutea TaxID=2810512 RepID=A0A974WJU8_9BACT|nr:RNA polymerase sigma factor [Fulvivirga lutea]
MQQGEIELIELLKAGDGPAFKHLVEEHQDKVFRLCLGYVKNEEEAEDVAQEVFIEVHESITGFEMQSSLSTWIFRIAVNKSLERIRYYKRSKRFGWLTSLFGSEEKYSKYSYDWVNPGVKLENAERSQVLYRAIDSLPEKQHAAFIMHKVEGISYKEIAEVMELSLSAVESLIFRANSNLRKQLEQYYKVDKS